MTYTLGAKTPDAKRTLADIREEFANWARMRGVRSVSWAENGSRGSIGAEVVWTLPGEEQRSVRCASQSFYDANLRVCYLAIHDLRMAEVRGLVEVLREAYTALPSPRQEQPRRPWHEVLGVVETAEADVVQAAYRALAKRYHPDNGTEPNAARMTEINLARTAAAAAGRG